MPAVIFLALQLTARFPLEAQEAGLLGRVAGEDSVGIERVLVSIPELSRSTLSDGRGEFSLFGLPSGRFVVRFQRFGFRPVDVQVTLSGIQRMEVELGRSPIRLEGLLASVGPTRGGVSYQTSEQFFGDSLRRLSGSTLGEMLREVPGVRMRSLGPAATRPILRGLDGERLLVLENGERIGDVQQTQPDHAVTLDPLDLQRVEVLRGAASLIHGSSALGGVVNVITRDVPDDWAPGVSGGVSVQGASVNGMAAGTGRLLVSGDQIASVSHLTYRRTGETATPRGLLENTAARSISTGTGLGFRSDVLEGAVSVSYYRMRYGTPEFAVGVDEGGGFVEEAPHALIQVERARLQTHGEWRPARRGPFESIDWRFSASRSDQFEADEGSEGRRAEENAHEEDEHSGSHLKLITDQLGSTILFRLHPLDSLGRPVFGMTLRRRYQELSGEEAYHPGEDLWNLAAYVVHETPVTSRLNVQIGARLEREWLSTVPNERFRESYSKTATNVAWAVSANWRAEESVEIGAQVARSHRNPTILERYASGWHARGTRVEIGSPALPSEIGHGIDAYARLDHGRFRVDLSGFWNRIDDFVLTRPLPLDCGGTAYSVPSPWPVPRCVGYVATDALLVGGEIRGSIGIAGGLSGQLTGDLVHGSQRERSDEPLSYMPPPRATAGLTYEGSGWLVGAKVVTVAAQKRTAVGELPTAGYSLVGLNGTFSLMENGRHVVTWRIDNLFDTAYEDHLSLVRRYPSPVDPERPVRVAEAGRNVELTYHWMF